MNAGYEYTLSKAIISVNGVSITLPFPWTIAFGSIIAYILLIACALKTTFWRPFIKRIGTTHYSLLFVYSTACFLAAFYELVMSSEGTSYLSWLISHKSTTLPTFYCQPVPFWLRIISLSFIVSKIWEWVDTLVLLANGKSLADIGFLHLYHHSTTFFLFLFTTSFPVTEKAGLLLNGLVHSLMYFHFAYRLPKFMRPVLTGIQIIQLVTVTLLWIDCSRVCPDAIAYRAKNPIEFAIPFALVPVYIVLFVKFFLEQYCCIKRTATKVD